MAVNDWYSREVQTYVKVVCPLVNGHSNKGVGERFQHATARPGVKVAVGEDHIAQGIQVAAAPPATSAVGRKYLLRVCQAFVTCRLPREQATEYIALKRTGWSATSALE